MLSFNRHSTDLDIVEVIKKRRQLYYGHVVQTNDEHNLHIVIMSNKVDWLDNIHKDFLE